jgi:hypothetical protein
MFTNKLLTVMGLTMLFAAVDPCAPAQQSSPLAQPRLATPPRPTHARSRILITPGHRLLYRRCIDWYELQHRPSGTVLYPQMRCWWALG